MSPEDLRYSREHEWVSVLEQDADSTGAVVRVGITAYAADSLGDVVFVSLPAIGGVVSAGQVIGELESTKSVSELYAPISGTVSARNPHLDDQPELINSDPYGDGWMIEIEVDELDGLERLLDAAAYDALIADN